MTFLIIFGLMIATLALFTASLVIFCCTPKGSPKRGFRKGVALISGIYLAIFGGLIAYEVNEFMTSIFSAFGFIGNIFNWFSSLF